MKQNISAKKDAAFAVPFISAESHLDAIKAVFGRAFNPKEALIHNLEIDVLLFPGTVKGRSCKDLLFGDGGLLQHLADCEYMEGRIGDRIVPIAISKTPQLEARNIESIQKMDLIGHEDEPTDAERIRTIAWTHYQEYLELFSCITGYHIVFDPLILEQHEPDASKDRTIHVMLTNPPGEVGTLYVQSLFGHRIHRFSEYVEARKPTLGRGVAVKDNFGTDICQILGNTFYILFPIFSTFHQYGSLDIFKKTFIACWKAFRDIQKGKLKPPREEEGLAAFMKQMEPNVLLSLKYWKEKLKATEEKIEEARRRLEQTYRTQLEYRAIVNGLENEAHMKATIARLPEDYRRIRKHPLTACLYTCDMGLHIETKMVEIRFDGIDYQIGRFVIRFGMRGDLSIWPIETRHPLGEPHPHIRKGGTPCFGTASSAIAKAIGELRFADCHELICKWITNYAPETKTSDISEWDYDRILAKGLAQLHVPEIRNVGEDEHV